jgi:hypothetical protein
MFWEDSNGQMVCPAILGGGSHTPKGKESTLRKIEAGRLAETIRRQLESTTVDPGQRVHLYDVEWGLNSEDHSRGTRGFQAAIIGTGQRFEFTVREVTPEPENLPARFLDTGGCYGNNDAEVRAAALAKAAVAFPGSKLEIWGSYDLHEAAGEYEKLQGNGYAGQMFVATTIRVRATG